MAQPSVAREPSMEEILASIRRIIESNEPAPSNGFPGQPATEFELGEVELDVDFAEDTSAEIPSPPAHVPPAANQGYGARQFNDFAPVVEREEPVAEKSMSLADVAARVRAAADRNATLGPQGSLAHGQGVTPLPTASPAPTQSSLEAERPQVAQPARPTDVRPLLAATAPQPLREMPTFNPPPQAAAPAPAPQPVPVWETMQLRGAVEEEKPVSRAVDVRQEPMAEPAVQKSEPKLDLPVNLVSAEAGAQIARSFGALAEVFDGVRNPTIETVAQDMLRPMLQEWLEDNLPTIVERMVREEIERVARGPRR